MVLVVDSVVTWWFVMDKARRRVKKKEQSDKMTSFTFTFTRSLIAPTSPAAGVSV